MLRGVYGDVSDFRSKIVQALPPVHRVDAVASNLLTGKMADASDLVWLVGYGAVFFVLGLLVIRHRSMVE